MALHERYAVDVIIFTESVVTSPLFRYVNDAVVISEVFEHDQRNYSFKDTVGIAEDNTIQIIRNRQVVDALYVDDSAAKGVQVRFGEDEIILSESCDVSTNWFHTSDEVVITETSSYTISTPVSDTIEIEETNSYNIVRSMSVEDVITITEGYNVYLPDPINPSYSIPNVTTTDPIMFRDGSLEFSSRHYEFGNTDSLEFTRVVQETRGGDLIVGPTKAVVQTLQFSFIQLSNAKCDELLSFIRTTLGKEIEFRDHEGNWWDGIIMNPQTPKIQNGRHKFSIAIQFEGVLQ